MKALALLAVALGAFYLFYAGAMAVWSYLTLSSIVEDAVYEHTAGRRRRRSGTASSGRRRPRVSRWTSGR